MCMIRVRVRVRVRVGQIRVERNTGGTCRVWRTCHVSTMNVHIEIALRATIAESAPTVVARIAEKCGRCMSRIRHQSQRMLGRALTLLFLFSSTLALSSWSGRQFQISPSFSSFDDGEMGITTATAIGCQHRDGETLPQPSFDFDASTSSRRRYHHQLTPPVATTRFHCRC
ncbi:hypothetical protein MIMGU_mgv1a015008mg [Erythranthe guttata]|uniref:Uncharacterized protein n=1 Tax=Erythranthe guttata TaxID=4155 RepID=A0A022RTJ0_ERYGU|nr:hypothetical protein MIMGU_mgv1a015008mg [Erythranthe guttata]